MQDQFTISYEDDEPKKGRKGLGLKDGGHIIINCSNCSAPLCDVWITQPKVELKTKIKAECPHCGESSFAKKVQGKFHLGNTKYTDILKMDVQYVDDDEVSHVLIETSKGEKKYA